MSRTETAQALPTSYNDNLKIQNMFEKNENFDFHQNCQQNLRIEIRNFRNSIPAPRPGLCRGQRCACRNRCWGIVAAPYCAASEADASAQPECRIVKLIQNFKFVHVGIFSM